MKLDSPPYNTSVDDIKEKRLSSIWQMWFSAFFNYLYKVVDYSNPVLVVPVTGFVINIVPQTQVLTLNPAGVLATGTLVLPPNPADGQSLEVSSTQTIISLTITPSAGQTVYNAPTTLVAGVGFAYYYRQTTTSWYRRY